MSAPFTQNSGHALHIHQNTQNLGYVKNFEKAISLCTQDIIFMCDQDDIWSFDKIKKVVRIFDSELETGLVLHNFCWIDGQDQPWSGPVDTYGPAHLRAMQLPEEIKARSIHVFMRPYPRAWCGCMMAFRRSFNSVILPIFPGKGHDDWILKVLAPITQTRFIAAPLVHYRMHERNTNRRDLDAKTLEYLWGRLIRKATYVLKGYNKRNFYRLILKRLRSSGLPIKFPSLISLYEKYA